MINLIKKNFFFKQKKREKKKKEKKKKDSFVTTGRRLANGGKGVLGVMGGLGMKGGGKKEKERFKNGNNRFRTLRSYISGF